MILFKQLEIDIIDEEDDDSDSDYDPDEEEEGDYGDENMNIMMKNKLI